MESGSSAAIIHGTFTVKLLSYLIWFAHCATWFGIISEALLEEARACVGLILHKVHIVEPFPSL